MSVKITQRKLLIVEGNHEEQFFNAALANHLKLVDIQVLGVGGKTTMGQNLRALANDARFPAVESIAVIRDADQSIIGAATSAAQSAFASAAGAIVSAALTPPTAHGHFSTAHPRVGVFIMPDGVSDGALETLCVGSLVSVPAYACVVDYFQCLAAHGLTPDQIDKGRIHAWLASQPEPDKHIGLAAQSGYWDWNHAAFNDLWDFLRAM